MQRFIGVTWTIFSERKKPNEAFEVPCHRQMLTKTRRNKSQIRSERGMYSNENEEEMLQTVSRSREINSIIDLSPSSVT